MTVPRAVRYGWPIVLLLVLIALPFNGLSGYWLDTFYFVFTYVALAVGWNVIAGFTGYISLANLGFFGMGSYMAGLMLTHFGWPIMLSAPLVGLICSFVAIGVGWVALRVRGPSFVIVTLAFTFIVQFLALNLKDITGGSAGLYLPLLQTDALLRGALFYFYTLGLAAFAVVVAMLIRRSRFGLGLIAIREDEGKAEGSGINTQLFKICAFAISIWFAAVAGAVHAQYLDYIDPDLAFELVIMLNIIVMTLLGSRGTIWGPVLGAFLLYIVNQQITYNLPPSFQVGGLHLSLTPAPLAVLGLVLLAVARFMPDGLLLTAGNLFSRFGTRTPRQPETAATTAAAPQ